MNVVAYAIIAVWIVSAGDHYTTWAMLQAPVPGFDVTEANPVARWLFSTFGLVGGLAVDSVFTFLAGLWMYETSMFTEKLKILWCLAVIVGTAYAIHNNVQALYATGVWQ